MLQKRITETKKFMLTFHRRILTGALKLTVRNCEGIMTDSYNERVQL